MISESAMDTHLRNKEHKKRVRTNKEIPYSHEEAERAAGLQPATKKFTDLIYQGKTKMEDYFQQNQLAV